MSKYREAFAKRMATAGLKPHHRLNKISGKLVLGFGVIWWSTTTVLTPIAARVRLPFFLVMRAFMGIGKESKEEVTDTEQAENWFSLTYAQRICGGYFEYIKF
ncbi:hypothetical protein LOK49_LG14G01701 [Camellia lanceoleosa]|uniref:Uncharacterized protein n=1 Tax=Camellia lanceoleosa TaxID=1840588 RepID=A0ACC0F9Z3_9ERIC|nr:hypothetical protein LOK49_LG14G01701 [Camellia lanceoleosa]